MSSPVPSESTPSPESAPRRPGCLRRLAEVAAALLVALVLAEVAARLFLRIPARGSLSGLGMKVNVPEELAPGMVNELRPDAAKEIVYPAVDGEGRRVTYRVNADGWRDRRYPKERAPGTFRIAVLGDSVAFGVGVDAEDTVPKIVERTFHERMPDGERVEVMNCGIYAYNTLQQVAHLNHRVLDHRPDLVVFLANVNDASGDGVRVTDGPKSRRWEIEWIRRLGLTSGRWDPDEVSPLDANQEWMLRLRNASALADLLANRAYSYLRGRVVDDNYSMDWAEGSPGREMVDDALGVAARLANRHDLDVLVAMYPVLSQLDAYPLEACHDALEAICARHGLDYLDLLPALEGLEARALHAHAHDKHPNARANERVAELLYPHLAERAAAALGD